MTGKEAHMSRRKYFLQVSCFNNTTKLGHLLNKKIYAKYNHTLVTEGEEVQKIVQYIRDEMKDELMKNRRLKEMLVTVNTYDKNYLYILLHPRKSVDYAFNIRGILVKNEFVEDEND